MVTNKKNGLWRARKKSGLSLKQVSTLLEHQSTKAVSAFERGARMPTLETALMLEIAYHTPVRLLFDELYESKRQGFTRFWQMHKSTLPEFYWHPKAAESLGHEEFCFYSELLKSKELSSPEHEMVVKHTITLIQSSTDHASNKKHWTPYD